MRRPVWAATAALVVAAGPGATDRVDEVTPITCAGTLTNGLGYDHRFVVRALRTP